MPRYKMTLEYDGRPFSGWQTQRNCHTVQGCLENAIEKMVGQPITTYGSGRTDKGVHALGQVVHIDLDRPWEPAVLCRGLNHYLTPEPIAILWAQEVDPTFHARFSAIRRHYIYRIINRPARLALEEGRAWWLRFPLDESLMQQAATFFVGHHDFSAFRSKECQSSNPWKTLERFEVQRQGDLITCHVSSRSFLHHQVRMMVGTLKEIALKGYPPESISELLRSGEKKPPLLTTPPGGLYLSQIDYE